MKLRTLGILTMALFVSTEALAGAKASAKSTPKKPAIDNTTFSVDLYKTLANKDGNLFISPFSISSAMVMAYVGANGKTAEELATALRLKNKKAAVHNAYKTLNANLRKTAEKTKNTLTIANGLCLTNGDVADSYKNLLKTTYDAEVFKGDVDVINAWVKEKTNGKIPILMERLDPRSQCVLLNAIYFKGRWRPAFDPKMTRKAPFHTADGKTVDCQMMNADAYAYYGKGKGFAAATIHYRGKKNSMVIFLPDKEKSLAEFEKELTGKKLKDWLKVLYSQNSQPLDLHLPKFKFETSYNLVPSLAKLGVKDAFSNTNSDFRGMGKKKGELFISQVVHKALIEVNEEGTEAVAATGMDFGGEAAPPRQTLLKVDRPFFFLIRDNDTGTILFMGRVLKP